MKCTNTGRQARLRLNATLGDSGMKITNTTLIGAAFGGLTSLLLVKGGFLLKEWGYHLVRILNFPAYFVEDQLSHHLFWRISEGGFVRLWAVILLPIVQWGMIGCVVGLVLKRHEKGSTPKRSPNKAL